MAGILLFCIAEEAEHVHRSTFPLQMYDSNHQDLQFVRTVLDTGSEGRSLKEEEGPKNARLWYLVESRDGPPEGQPLKKQLPDDEAFEFGFIGASPTECQEWANQRCRHDRAPMQTIIAIIDARSAKDGTILMQKYVQPPAGTEDFIFGEYGVLPQQTNVWYDFRVDHRHAGKVEAALCFTAPNVTFPFWYGNKERFTGEDGVFDVPECYRYCNASDPDVVESEIFQRIFRNAPGYNTPYGPEH